MRLRTVLCALVALTAVGALHAQASLALKVNQPFGWDAQFTSATRVVFRKELTPKESATLRVSVASATTPGDDAAAFVARQKRPDEAVVEGSAGTATINDLKGATLTFSGKADGGRRSLREIAAARLKNGQFLVVHCDYSFAGDALSDDVKKSMATVRSALVRSIALTEKPTSQPATNPAPQRLSTANPKLYEDDSILPFSFTYPGEWFIDDDWKMLPGSHFVVLAPDLPGVDAAATPASKLPVVLRVQVAAHLPELQGAEDPTGRLASLVRETLAERTKSRLSAKEQPRFLIGATTAGLMEYSLPKDERPAREGFVVFAAVGTATLVADFSYPTEVAAEWKSFAYEILNSFRVGGDAVREHYEVSGISFDCPLAWETSRVKSPDDSLAIAARAADGTEVVLRSLAITPAGTLDPARFETLARTFLVDEMAMLDAKTLAEGIDVNVRGADLARRWTLIQDDRAVDVFGLVRGGAVHFGFVTAPSGEVTAAYGHAIDAVFSMAGSKPANAPGPLAGVLENHFRSTVVFGTASVEPYDADGKAKPESRGRLTLRPDGSATLRYQDARGETTRTGTYAAEGASCRFTFTDGLAFQAPLDLTNETLATPAKESMPARTWFLLPYTF